jgi:hypothetical protein
LHTSNVPRLTGGNTGPRVNTVDILTRGRENNVVCRNTRDRELSRVHLDQYVKAVEIRHTRNVDPKVDNGIVSDQCMAGRCYKDGWGPDGAGWWKSERR